MVSAMLANIRTNEKRRAHTDFTVYTVAAVETAGVLTDLYRPGIFREPIPTAHNVFIPWDAYRYHPRALAVTEVMELQGMEPVTPRRWSPLCGDQRP